MIGMKPSDMGEGGLFDNTKAKILEAGTCLLSYNNSAIEVPALRLVLGFGEDWGATEATRYIQHYSAGDLSNFTPTVGEEAFVSGIDEVTLGFGFDAVGSRGSLVKTSNAGMLMASMVAAGFDEDRFSNGNLTEALTGQVFHFKRQVQPDRPGIVNPEEESGGKKKGPRTILLVSEYFGEGAEEAPAPAKVAAKPGPKPAAPKPAAPKPATAPKAAVPAKAAAPVAAPPAAEGVDTEEMDARLVVTIMELLETLPGKTIKRPGLVTALYRGPLKNDPALRTYAGTRALEAAFLQAGADAGNWTYENSTLTGV